MYACYGYQVYQLAFFLAIILAYIPYCCHRDSPLPYEEGDGDSPRLYEEGDGDSPRLYEEVVIPSSKVTIEWHIIKPTPDGYIVNVTIYDFHKQNVNPSWTLGWTGQHVIQKVIKAQLKSNRSITNNNIVITSTATNSFKLYIADKYNAKTIKITRNVTFQAANIVYNCGPSKLVAWRVVCVMVPSEVLKEYQV